MDAQVPKFDIQDLLYQYLMVQKKALLKPLWAGLLWFWGSFKWNYVCSSWRHFVAPCVTHKSDTVSKQTLCRHLSITNDPIRKLVKLSADLPFPKLKTANKRLNFRIRKVLELFFQICAEFHHINFFVLLPCERCLFEVSHFAPC